VARGARRPSSTRRPHAVRWLGTALDSQTDCFKIDRIRLSVVQRRLTARQIVSKLIEFVCLSSVRWLGTALDGQTDCVKTNRIQNSSEFVCLSSTRPLSETMSDWRSFCRRRCHTPMYAGRTIVENETIQQFSFFSLSVEEPVKRVPPASAHTKVPEFSLPAATSTSMYIRTFIIT
jgi:hypothetical protein